MRTWTVGGCVGVVLAASGCGASNEPPSSTPEPSEHVLAVIDIPPVAPPSDPLPSASPRDNTPPPAPSVAPSAAPPAPSGSGSFFEVVPSPSASASASAPSATGVLDTKTAADIVSGMRPGFQGCLRAALVSQPGISGTMSLDVDLKADGTIQKITPRNANAIPKTLVACVTGVVEATSFPRTVGGKSILLNIPINFTH